MIVQGDVFFVRIQSIPKESRKMNRDERGFIIAEGEATGHAHVINDAIELYEKDGILYVKTEKTVEVMHEEHRSVTLDPGIWKVGIVREYDPFLEEIRRVKD